MADGSRQSYGWGEALFKIEGSEMTSPVVFGPEGRYLLGAPSLQSFNLTVDPIRHRLAPAPEITL